MGIKGRNENVNCLLHHAVPATLPELGSARLLDGLCRALIQCWQFAAMSTSQLACKADKSSQLGSQVNTSSQHAFLAKLNAADEQCLHRKCSLRLRMAHAS